MIYNHLGNTGLKISALSMQSTKRNRYMMKARKPFIIAVLLCFFASLDMQAQQTSKASDDSWVDLTENLMAAIPDFREGPNALMNGIGALGVEPQSGRLYVFVQLNGLYLSEDMGQTFKRIDEGKVLGRMLGGGNISVDPEKPGRAAFFTVDALDQNGAGAITLDGGKTLKAFKKPEIDGFTYGAVDWRQPKVQTLLAREHHARGNQLYFSSDAGQSWKHLDVEAWQPGVFSADILLGGAGSYKNDINGILRSSDAGATWKEVSEADVAVGSPVRQEESIYWLTMSGLAVSQDKGASWELRGTEIPEPIAGPLMGKSPGEMILVASDGFHYSDNAGLTWQHLWEAEDTAPPGYRGGRESIPRQSYGWDPTHHLLYATSRSGKLMRRILPAPAE